ncbi:unnamed protein product, partial [Onchocerca flexuosa]|uniref:EGF-like domain-containing protein n=1 Tax=Onchocerca flexuosa TaxID=387005 RepID=A0A183H4Y7_9BILA
AELVHNSVQFNSFKFSAILAFFHVFRFPVCFPGYVKCGSYCVSLQYAAQCFINPKCDNSPTSPQFCDIIKEKLCSVEGTVPCKGYGECVMRKWIENGQTNCIDKSDQDLAYIAVFGIKRGTNLYPDLQFAGNTSNNTNSIQRFVPSWLQSVSPSSSSFGLTDDTSRGSLSTMTKDWSNTITQSTTQKFIFKMPNNDLNGQDFKSSDFDIAVAEFSNKTGIVNGSIQVSHKVQQNFRNLVANNGLQSSSNFQNFTILVDDNQAEHNSGHNSNATDAIYQLHSTTVKSDKADEPATESPQPSFIYRPGENPMDQISGKLENSIRASTNSDAIRTDNSSNRLRFSGSLKQDNVIEPSDISSSSDVSQNQHGIFLDPSASKPSNSAKNKTVIQKESQQILPLNASNQYPEERTIKTFQNSHSSNSATSSTSNDLFNTIISATSTPSPDQMACARYEYAEAKRLVPKPSCTCPPGQMPSGGNGEHVTCKTTIISTFGLDVRDMCGGLETDPNERSRLAILVLTRTQLPYQACVRRDGHPVMVQLDCSQCTITEFDEAFKRNSNDQYVPLRITELSLGACLTSALNDCDPEHADCLVDGPRYECRCHEGWNDTSKEFGQAEGRRCEQLLLFASGCILFLGYCLMWWFLLLGIILFLILPLLCWLGYKLCKWCQKRRRRNAIGEQGHLVTSEVGPFKNTNPNLLTTESFSMNNNPSYIGSTNAADGKKTVSTIDTKNISDSISSGNQNISNATEKVLSKQQSMKSIDLLHKYDEVKSDGLIFDGSKSERKKSEQKVTKTPVNHLVSTESSISSQKKTTSETHTESSEVSSESQKNTNMMVSVIPQKNIEMLIKDGKIMKSLENVESADPKIMKVSRSLSETSLRTMWELFKQGMWKQSSRPSC